MVIQPIERQWPSGHADARMVGSVGPDPFVRSALRKWLPLHALTLDPFPLYRSLRGNALSGSLPDTFCTSLASLQYFNFGNTALNVSLDSLSACTQLMWLSSYGNSELVGTIPVSVTSLYSLQHLDLRRTGLSGSIPSAITSLVHLKTLQLSHNNFSGTLPVFYSLPVLLELDILQQNMCDAAQHRPPCSMLRQHDAVRAL